MTINEDWQGINFKDSKANLFHSTFNFGSLRQTSLSNPPKSIPYRGVANFVGRQQELAELHEKLQKPGTVPIYAIAGMGGVGKTELATQYAHQHEADYPGGICWLNARESDLAVEIIQFAQLHMKLEVPEQDFRGRQLSLTEQVAWSWQHWQPPEGLALVVFNDVTDLGTCQQFMPTAHRFRVLMTTRLRNLDSNIEEISLDVLSPEEALQLLTKLVGERRVQREEETAKLLCEWLRYLPLGLELVGRYLAEDRGKALQDGLSWAKDKSLNYEDREFLAASQAKEKEEAIVALEKSQQIIKINIDGDEIIRQRLNERGYLIQDIVGGGGFGITYLTIDKINQENLVVIKTIKNELLQSIKSNRKKLESLTRSIDSFRNEASILLLSKHPNIVQIYSILSESFEIEIGKHSKKQSEKSTYKLELLFLVMEYIEGKNLEEIVSERDSPLPEAEALRYIQQIGEALVVLHSKGLLHRDIKPQNIMVREATNDAVLIDFGIARDFIPEITASMTVAFTHNYSPPEQRVRRDKRDKYTDMYGLAATLYYLLTEEPPTDAFERGWGRSDSLVEPQQINPDISDRVNQAILWGMELEPSKRPQTVEEWLAKLFSSKLN